MSNLEKDQQDFCKGALESIQELISRMDSKAGTVMTVVGLLSAALFALFTELITKILVSKIFFWAVVLYFIVMTYVLWRTMQVFLARSASLGNHSQAPLMLFPFLILEKFKTDKDYAERARKLTFHDMISDYANQIMECSNIYKLKHNYVNKSIEGLRVLLILWLVFMLIATWLIFSDANLKSSTLKQVTQAVPVNPKN